MCKKKEGAGQGTNIAVLEHRDESLPFGLCYCCQGQLLLSFDKVSWEVCGELRFDTCRRM